MFVYMHHIALKDTLEGIALLPGQGMGVRMAEGPGV